MRPRLMILLGVALLLLPSTAVADAALVQESCQLVPGTSLVEVRFSIVNFSLPSAVCALTLIAEPLPPDPSCELTNVSSPVGWAGFLNPLFGADWFANSLADCVEPNGNFEPNFDFTLIIDKSNLNIACCFIVQFQDATGAVLIEQEECFCAPVPNEGISWSMVKALF